MDHYGTASVQVYQSPQRLGSAAAEDAVKILRSTIARKGKARLFIATGNSQIEFMKALVQHRDLDWSAAEVFHLDEYVGIPASHPSSFRHWIRTRFAERVHPGRIHYIDGDAADPDAEIRKYAALIEAAPIDLAFMGIGENGHIAFNDPPVADFADPAIVKRVTLDEACRRQQEGEGHFPSFDAVPREAITVTCSALLRVETWICCVPDSRKARAVRDSLEGPISPACPGSLIRKHPNSFIYLDQASAALLTDAANLISGASFSRSPA